MSLSSASVSVMERLGGIVGSAYKGIDGELND